jgi:hypothetical protein
MWWLQLWYNSQRDGNHVVINSEKLRAFEDERIRTEKVDIERNFRIVDALYDEARMLGVLPPKDPLEGIDVKIRMAHVFNGIKCTPQEAARKLAKLGGPAKKLRPIPRRRSEP